ncbi:hypothetical protein HPP92_006885 [Vanilla planifolia]|uniref:Uncharacterized protein n=1 Tax=Vanilla planifolia TaxID=51239 RepID=A0A835RD90_VANPL|nr:hypothetical protein HPP92_007119 [Vanilla planifolia]KAG0490022.1 hypothetical protein HPP92_006885 [Vanilla planifolia]
MPYVPPAVHRREGHIIGVPNTGRASRRGASCNVKALLRGMMVAANISTSAQADETGKTTIYKDVVGPPSLRRAASAHHAATNSTTSTKRPCTLRETHGIASFN